MKLFLLLPIICIERSMENFLQYDHQVCEDFTHFNFDLSNELAFNEAYPLQLEETLYYGGQNKNKAIRNTKDSSFYPRNKPAGIKGITRKLLYFIENVVNPIGYEVADLGRQIEDISFIELVQKHNLIEEDQLNFIEELFDQEQSYYRDKDYDTDNPISQ